MPVIVVNDGSPAQIGVLKTIRENKTFLWINIFATLQRQIHAKKKDDVKISIMNTTHKAQVNNTFWQLLERTLNCKKVKYKFLGTCISSKSR